jgi:hypothetical protein
MQEDVADGYRISDLSDYTEAELFRLIQTHWGYEDSQPLDIQRHPSYWKHLFEKSMDGFCGFLALVSMIGGVILVALDFQDSWGGFVLLPVCGLLLFLMIGS